MKAKKELLKELVKKNIISKWEYKRIWNDYMSVVNEESTKRVKQLGKQARKHHSNFMKGI